MLFVCNIKNPFPSFLHVAVHMIKVGDVQSDYFKCNWINKAQSSTETLNGISPYQKIIHTAVGLALAEDLLATGSHQNNHPSTHEGKTPLIPKVGEISCVVIGTLPSSDLHYSLAVLSTLPDNPGDSRF